MNFNILLNKMAEEISEIPIDIPENIQEINENNEEILLPRDDNTKDIASRA